MLDDDRHGITAAGESFDRTILCHVHQACKLGETGWAEAYHIDARYIIGTGFGHPNGTRIAPTLRRYAGFSTPLVEIRDRGSHNEYRLTDAGRRARRPSRAREN